MKNCNCTPRFLLNGKVSHAPTCPEHPSNTQSDKKES